MTERFRATLSEAYSWGSQVVQYADAPLPQPGEVITYYAGVEPGRPPVDCLLYWVHDTRVNPAERKRPRIAGILNHYPVDYPPWEQAGNVNVWVRKPDRRKGIATALIREAARRWTIRPEQQRLTPDGVALAESLFRALPSGA